jgi:hypothetical protein
VSKAFSKEDDAGEWAMDAVASIQNWDPADAVGSSLQSDTST